MTLRDRHTPGRERAGDPFAGAEDGPLPDVGGGAYAPSVRSATTTFRGHPASVPAARRWVVATLAEWGLQATGWAAAQIVSELATNCTLHARSDFTVRVALDSTCLRIEAEDASPVALQSRAYSATSTTGRGLGIVDVLARRVGCHLQRRRQDRVGAAGGRQRRRLAARGRRAPAGGTRWARRSGRRPDRSRGPRSSRVTAQGPDGELRPVRMLELPVQIWAASQEHHDELLREFALMTVGHAETGAVAAPVPLRLLRLVTELTQRFAGTSERQREQLFAAAVRGELVIPELTYELPAAVGPASVDLGRMLDEADEYCRDGEHLLTLATPDEVRLFRELVPAGDRAPARGRGPRALAGVRGAGRRALSPSPLLRHIA